MIIWSASALLLMLLSAAPEAPARPPQRVYQSVTVREQIIIRVPRPRHKHYPAVEWKEGKGPKCIPSQSVIGATLLGRESVDLILRGGGRIRAKLESSCPALDYYHGFYIKPNSDRLICADRDVIRSRMGGQCEIDGFRTLKPVPKG